MAIREWVQNWDKVARDHTSVQIALYSLEMKETQDVYGFYAAQNKKILEQQIS